MGIKARTTVQTARVEHSCSLCGGPIRAGELYTRRYRDDHRGRARYVKKCQQCAADYLAAAAAETEGEQ